MKNQLAKVKNIRKLSQAYESLAQRDINIPRMGLISGFSGAGKSQAIGWLISQVDGVLVRANACWTVSSMLAAIVVEIGTTPVSRNALMLKQIVDSLAASRRPLIIDECDYLLRDPRMVETLRDIHDLAGVPVIMVGMEGIEKKLAHRKQLSRRISQFIEFAPLDLEDAETLAETVCEVAVAPDLLQKIHKDARGSIGLMIVGLAQVEALAKTQQWNVINCQQWGNRKLFLSAKVG
ncbi:AAA family ATPase [Anabaena lutea]|uniref:ATP-binding protein n=1 Tax=Anabaena lutea FACHB-196 TaxID=2692881 RepID=A0ABR8FIG0_9NOST|nr:ATP-binding protein [Anabaena lutea]MBD2570027.1 ATP-binding protein [Anabaena lutea FACHB-196]